MNEITGYLLVALLLGGGLFLLILNSGFMRRWRHKREFMRLCAELKREGIDPASPEGREALGRRLKGSNLYDPAKLIKNVDGAGSNGYR